ncbi:MAG: hypothetical protein ACR2GQ_09855 [Gemmatimonadota bacterium]
MHEPRSFVARVPFGKGALVGGVLLWLAACGGSAAPDTAVSARSAGARSGPTWSPELEAQGSGARPMAPVGYGSLSQDDITVLVQEGNLRIKAVPLAEWVIRLTAPDTYRRLNSYKVSRSEDILAASSRAGERGWPTVFLVTFFSQAVEESFEPNDLQIRNESFLYRPLDIIAVTPDFGRERLRQQETQIALYVFSPDIDFNLPITVEYGGAASDRWNTIRRSLDAELARATSRAGATQP